MDTFITDKRRWTRRDVAELLISKTALTELDLEAATQVAQLMQARRIKAGTVLMREGVTNTGYMVLVLQGEAVVENEIANANDSMVITVLGPGSLIGELGILDDKPRSATCTAVSDMDLAVLDQDGLAELIRTDGRVGSALLGAILRRVADRLRQTNRRLLTLTQINRSLHQELDAYRDASKAQLLSISRPARTLTDAGACIDFDLTDPLTPRFRSTYPGDH